MVPTLAQAQAAPAPATSFSVNAGLTSDYRYRGISQSRLKPALSVGADFSTAGGLYVGTWLSTIKWVKDGGGGANAELDVYGGYKFKALGGDVDVGVLAYVYPSHGLSVAPNTVELYGSITSGPLMIKYSHSLTNLFGFDRSRGSGYIDLTYTHDFGGGLSGVGHLGYQMVNNYSASSYADYKIGLTKDASGWVLVASIIGANNKNYLSPNNKNLGRAGLVLSLNNTF